MLVVTFLGLLDMTMWLVNCPPLEDTILMKPESYIVTLASEHEILVYTYMLFKF